MLPVCLHPAGPQCSTPAPAHRLQAAAKLWPEVFQTPEAESRKEELVEKMRVVRPVVETGCVVPGSSKFSQKRGAAAVGTSSAVNWRCKMQLVAKRAREHRHSSDRLCRPHCKPLSPCPSSQPALSDLLLILCLLLLPPCWLGHACRYENIVQIRCLLEGVDPQDMLLTWHDMLPQYMQRWQLDRTEVGGWVGSRREAVGARLGLAAPRPCSPPACRLRWPADQPCWCSCSCLPPTTLNPLPAPLPAACAPVWRHPRRVDGG